MLDRYRKPGGFVQLLNLLETCGPAKRDKFLQIIREDDGRWADALEKRILTIAKIFSWSDEAIAEIASNLQDLTIAVAFHGFDPKQREVFCKTFTHSRRRKIQDLFETNRPTPSESETMLNKILVETRKQITEGRLRLEKIDPDMVIPENIEELFKKEGKIEEFKRALTDISPHDLSESTPSAGVLTTDRPSAAVPSHVFTGSPESLLKDELLVLRRKLAALAHENSVLKQDISRLQTKLDQIKKIA